MTYVDIPGISEGEGAESLDPNRLREVTPWDDLLRLGTLAACRDQGPLRLEGKDYIVRDGEIVHFRFNV